MMTNKKYVLTGLAVLVLGLGALSGTSAVQASVTVPNSTDATEAKKDATTDTTVTLQAGTLSLYNVTDAASFDKANLGTIFSTGLDTKSKTPLAGAVDDFQGLSDAKDAWTLKVAQSGWTADTTDKNSTPEGAKALGVAATLSYGDAKTAITTDGVTYETGAEGQTTLTPQSLNLAVAKGTVLRAGTYTNTLNWTLTSDPSATQE